MNATEWSLLRQLSQEMQTRAETAPAKVQAMLRSIADTINGMRGMPALECHKIFLSLVAQGVRIPQDAGDLFNASFEIRDETRRNVPTLPVELGHLETATNGDTLEVRVTGYLDTGIAGSVADAITRIAAAKRVVVKIHSLGGLTQPALDLYQALIAHPDAVTEINELALSSGAIIALAGKHRRIVRTGFISTHGATSAVAGGVEWLLQSAAGLEKHEGTLAEIFVNRTEQPLDVVRGWASDVRTQYFNATDAVKVGFCHEIFDAAPLDTTPATESGAASNDSDVELESFAIEFLNALHEKFANRGRFRRLLRSLALRDDSLKTKKAPTTSAPS